MRVKEEVVVVASREDLVQEMKWRLAMCLPGGVTIVVVPLIALKDGMVRRCKESGIKCTEWDASRPPELASIVLVTAEAAVGHAFQRFMQQKKSIGQLDRVVIDECHVVLDSKRETA